MTSLSSNMAIHTGTVLISNTMSHLVICTCTCRSVKWWKRLFYHLLDLSIVNANILYNKVSEKPMTQLDFRVSIVSAMLDGHSPRVVQRFYAPNCKLPTRLSERPFSERISSDTAHGGRPQCEVCRSQGKRSQTRYQCKICKTPLHLESHSSALLVKLSSLFSFVYFPFLLSSSIHLYFQHL